MKALSLTRPWATLVLHHGKNVENRTWATSYRGPLVIHGAKSYDRRAESWAIKALGRSPVSGRESDEPTGLLGTVELVAQCLATKRGESCDCGPWAMPEQVHWHLRNPRPFPEPIPHAGRLGLWEVDDALLLAAATGNLTDRSDL